MVEAQKFFGEGFEITPDGKVIDKKLDKEIPGFTIVPFNEQTMIPPYGKEVTWGWQRVYEFEGKTDFTVVGTEANITVTENNGLDMFGWIYESGEFQRETKEFDAPNGSEVNIEIYNTLEAELMVATNSSENPVHRIDNFSSIRDMTDDVLEIVSKRGTDQKWKLYITCLGMYQEISDGYWATNQVPMVDNNGVTALINTTEYIVKPFKNRSLAAVGWYDINDAPKVIIVESNIGLDMPYIFNPFWKENPIKDTFDK
jgi:hypothetical protein